ncbi:MAG: transporter permease protein [Symbiobacteriaceae bacterium]|jgi:ABC-type dipeptide/oligopeptide/nickel transport system permease component|nr:transporter permease protein [Symbiobacteriaceae bacterium]
MWKKIWDYRRLLFKLLAETAGLALLVIFVVGLATMPPIDLTPNPKSPIGYNIKVDTAQWKSAVTSYIKVVESGSLGKNRRGQDVVPVVMEYLGRSLLLLGLAWGLALALGVIKGFWDFQSMRKRRIALGPMVTSAFAGAPDFWLVLMIQWGASWLWILFDFNAFKVAYDTEKPGLSTVYPVIALCLIPLAHIARITASSMSNVYGKDYVRTARAKGVHEFLVVFKHALRNALVQILDSLPGVMAATLSNLLIVEYMFNYPGLTRLLKEAVAPQAITAMGGGRVPTDVPVLVVAGLSLGLIFTLFYILVRLARKFADPRLKGRDVA